MVGQMGHGDGRWENKEQGTQAEEVWEVHHRDAAALGWTGRNSSIPGGFQGLPWQSHGKPAVMTVTVLLHREKGLGVSKVPLNQELCGATGGKCKDLNITSNSVEETLWCLLL